MKSQTTWLDRLFLSMKWAKQTPLPEGHYDAVVVGGGHNGLTCAALLAKQGKKVILCEARETLGGACQTGAISKEVVASRVAHVVRDLHPKLIDDLRLSKFGYKQAGHSLPTIALGKDGNHLTFGKKMWETGGSIVEHSEPDAEKFAEFYRQFRRWRKIADQWQFLTPLSNVDLEGSNANEFSAWFEGVRGANAEVLQELARLSPGSVGDLLDSTFETDLLKGALSFDAVIGSGLGPRAPGSTWQFIRASNCMGGNLSLPVGGMGAITEALSRAIEHFGGELRCGHRVERILIDKTSVVGVELEDGERVFANRVISAIDPKSAMLDLVGSKNLETEVVKSLASHRPKGTAAKLNLSLSRLPAITGFQSEAIPSARYLIAPSLGYLEDAYVKCFKGQLPDQPAMELIFPTLADDTLSPSGNHVATIIVQYVPYNIEDGWDEARDVLTQRCAEVLAQYMPDLEDCITGGELLTPKDIESEFGLPGGHWHSGDLNLSRQFDQRPVYGCSDYRLPIDGLYLCGAGCHPQGGVNGISAYGVIDAMGFEGQVSNRKPTSNAKTVDPQVVLSKNREAANG